MAIAQFFLRYGFLIQSTSHENNKGQERYIEWLHAEEMHAKTQEWLSELNFIKNEQAFLEKLIKAYQLDLNGSKYTKTGENSMAKFRLFRKETKKLLEIVESHNDKLKIMVDGLEQPEAEEAFKKVHLRLIATVAGFLRRYKQLKTSVYTLIKDLLKSKKQHLIA